MGLFNRKKEQPRTAYVPPEEPELEEEDDDILDEKINEDLEEDEDLPEIEPLKKDGPEEEPIPDNAYNEYAKQEKEEMKKSKPQPEIKPQIEYLSIEAFDEFFKNVSSDLGILHNNIQRVAKRMSEIEAALFRIKTTI